MQVADDIFQVQLPLPFPLKIVNCYMLRDGPGWAVIDSGLNYPAGQAAWQTAFAQLGIDPAAISRIYLTHAHPDHYGMAGWLAQQSGAPVFLSPGEQAFARRVWQHGATNERVVIDFFREHGLPADLAEQLRLAMIENRAMTVPWPEITPLAPSSQIRIGARTFQALATPGHSDEHIVFYSANDRLLLCGDAVLTKITPNVSCWPDGNPNPLADFLHSLARLATLEVDLALPGHGPLIRTFRQRLGELETHHHERLESVERAIGRGATTFEVCTAIFAVATLSPHQLRFAIAETLAHLEYLVGIGRLERAEQPRLEYRRIQEA